MEVDSGHHVENLKVDRVFVLEPDYTISCHFFFFTPWIPINDRPSILNCMVIPNLNKWNSALN